MPPSTAHTGSQRAGTRAEARGASSAQGAARAALGPRDLRPRRAGHALRVSWFCLSSTARMSEERAAPGVRGRGGERAAIARRSSGGPALPTARARPSEGGAVRGLPSDPVRSSLLLGYCYPWRGELRGRPGLPPHRCPPGCWVAVPRCFLGFPAA